MNRRKIAKIIVPSALAAIIAIVVIYKLVSGPPAGVLRTSGNIEVIDIELSFRVPGWVEKRPVDEGYKITKDCLIAALDLREYRQSLELAKAQAVAAKADSVFRDEDYERITRLYKQGIATENEFLTAKATRDESDANNIAAAKAEQIAQTRLDYATILSPIDGVVISKNAEIGEYVAPGTPVVTVADIKNVFLRAYVDETDLGRVKLWQKVLVSCDSFPGRKFEGKVTFISPQAEFTPKNVQTEKQRVKLVYRIKIDVPNPQEDLKPGMPADADIIVGDGR